MVITLLAWIYITFLCWAWGNILLNFFKKATNTASQTLHFSFVSLAGLSLITVIASLLSLIIPLGNWWVQLFFLLPAILLLLNKGESSFLSSLKKQFSGLHIVSLLLLCSLLLLVMVMSTWRIVHPDTLGYHAQTIQWIEKYEAVPGLVHLHVRFGYQGLWFVDNALFGFSFTGVSGVTFLNSTVLLWFFIFIVNRINHNFFKEGKKITGLLWLLLLAISMWSYTQIRLTATSASPDFIATLFILAIVYILLEKDVKHLAASEWMLVMFLSLVAVTIKLSVAPVLLIAGVATILIFSKRNIRSSATVILLFIFILTPFIARNVITSGYLVFPTTAIDIADVEWKFSEELTANEKNYITAYAKKQGVSTKEEIDTVNNMSIAEWLPAWWQQRSTADKGIIILFVLSFLAALVLVKKVIRSGFIPILVLITMLAGILFWFINAPDPRFGFGSILGFISIVAWLLFKSKEVTIHKNILNTLLIVSSAAVLTYTGYRFINFFEKDQWLKPLGIEKNEYLSFDCEGIRINSPSNNADFGTIPVPCTDFNCDKFSPRGAKIEDGFMAK